MMRAFRFRIPFPKKRFYAWLPWMLFVAVFLNMSHQAFAKQGVHEVNWDQLDLTNHQRNLLDNLDEQWRSTVSDMVPRIRANEKKLKLLVMSPDANEAEILRLQQEIHEDKMRLKMEATQIFLHKRKVLSTTQQEKLMKMLRQD